MCVRRRRNLNNNPFYTSSTHPQPRSCQLSKTKCGYKPRSKGLSYSQLRGLVLEAFKDIVPDISAIGTHILRSGAATATANTGVPDRLFKRHGRWASESAKDGYVQDSLSSRLSVFKALSIQFSRSYRFLILVSIQLVLPGGPLFMGYSWPGVFPLGASGRTGRFFTQLLSPISVSF